MDPPTPLREPKEEYPLQSPGALNGFRKGIVKTLQTAPQYIMAGAVVAAAAAGFLKVWTEGYSRLLSLTDACIHAVLWRLSAGFVHTRLASQWALLPGSGKQVFSTPAQPQGTTAL